MRAKYASFAPAVIKGRNEFIQFRALDNQISHSLHLIIFVYESTLFVSLFDDDIKLLIELFFHHVSIFFLCISWSKAFSSINMQRLNRWGGNLQ